MSMIGRSINVALASLVVLSLVGTAGATLLFQETVEQVSTENDELRDRNERLRTQLNETRTERERTRARLRELNESLETTRADVS